MTLAARVASLAGAQDGVVSRAQLEKLGLGAAAITRWAGGGRLHRIHPGVYAVGHPHLDVGGRLRAALLYAGDDAALSHTTAAWSWGLIDAEPRRVHVTMRGRRRSLPSVRVHRTRHMAATKHRGLRVTPVARTLRDLATMLPSGPLRRALSEADRLGMLERREIEAVLGRGRRGSAALREAIDAHLPELAVTRSALEERFLLLCESAKLPLPAVNALVAGLEVDALWAERRLVVELDGHLYHSFAAAAERDRDRDMRLRMAGYDVRRYTWRQITAQPEAVTLELRRELARPAEPVPVVIAERA